MSFILQPWQFFFVILVGWVQREQQKIILFYQAELETMMKAQGKKRLLLTDDQRRLLARRLGRARLPPASPFWGESGLSSQTAHGIGYTS